MTLTVKSQAAVTADNDNDSGMVAVLLDALFECRILRELFCHSIQLVSIAVLTLSFYLYVL